MPLKFSTVIHAIYKDDLMEGFARLVLHVDETTCLTTISATIPAALRSSTKAWLRFFSITVSTKQCFLGMFLVARRTSAKSTSGAQASSLVYTLRRFILSSTILFKVLRTCSSCVEIALTSSTPILKKFPTSLGVISSLTSK